MSNSSTTSGFPVMTPLVVSLLLVIILLGQTDVFCKNRNGLNAPGDENDTVKSLQNGLIPDFSFVEKAIQYLESGDDGILEEIARGAAAQHLLGHARDMRSGAPTDSPLSLVRSLLNPREENVKLIPKVKVSIGQARKFVSNIENYLAVVQSHLPGDFAFDGRLFFTFGYDIGVAYLGNASINLAHSKFLNNTNEIAYYCIHELHHAAFLKYHPFPIVTELTRAQELVELIEYATQFEGMAVFASYDIREKMGALNDDPDYIVLQNKEAMKEYVERYFSLYDQLVKKGESSITDDDWKIIEIFSDKERLWYRVGCHMAQAIEVHIGKKRLIDLISQGPHAFFLTYLKIEQGDTLALQ